MPVPTEPIDSIPRTAQLLAAMTDHAAGRISDAQLHAEEEATPAEVRDRVLETAEYIPVESLGTTDDCGFSPFADDTSTSREIAFAKIRSRVEGTRLASASLGV